MPDAVAVRQRPSGRFLTSYVALVVVPLAAMILILQFGIESHAGLARAAAAKPAPAVGLFQLPLFLGQIVVILGLSRLLAGILKRLGQPQVVGEMLTGILLGHSVLGVLAPQVHDFLFPRGSLRFLNALSQIGVLLFMYLVGLELDRNVIRRRGRAALLTSHASIALPMFLGVALATIVFETLAAPGVEFTPFALFLGAAMSVTAFPVLARVLSERRMQHTEIGTIAIASAAVDDVTAWCVLAVVVVIARAGSTALPLWATLGGLALHVGLMLGIVRPLLARHATRALDRTGVTPGLVAVVVIVTLASAWATEMLGVHALFGAFLAGIATPKDPRFVAGIKGCFEDLMLVLLLPLFFAYTGLRANVALLHGGAAWSICLGITAIAVLGKLVGSAVAARVAGMPWRQAATVGALMNTRGLMELIILNVGLDLGVITPTLFAMMVLMAIATTFMTTPLVDWLNPRATRDGASVPALAVAPVEARRVALARARSKADLAWGAKEAALASAERDRYAEEVTRGVEPFREGVEVALATGSLCANATRA